MNFSVDTSDQTKDCLKQDDSNVKPLTKRQLEPKIDVPKPLSVTASEVKLQNKRKTTKKPTLSDENSLSATEKVHKQNSTTKKVKTVTRSGQAIETESRQISQIKDYQLNSNQHSDNDLSDELLSSSDKESYCDSFFEEETSLDVNIEDKPIEVVLPDFYSKTDSSTSNKEKLKR